MQHPPPPPAVTLQRLAPPMAVKVAGRERIAYELLIRGSDILAADVRSIEVVSLPAGRALSRFDGEALSPRVQDLPNGAGVVAYIEIDEPSGMRAGRLQDRIVLRHGEGPSRAVKDAAVAVRREAATLAAPLAGGPWVAVHDARWPRGHRRVMVGDGAGAHVPGRFAVDFVKIGPTGSTTHGDRDRASDAEGYGAPVLAGADAVVAAAYDEMAESSSIVGNPKHSGAGAAGNYVVLALKRGQYAFYEHLRPGSVRVRAGDHVRVGQPLGELGFSGDSTGPHLHLHVASGPDPVQSDGLPFVLQDYRQVGRYRRIEDLGRAAWSQTPGRAVHREWPGYNVVVKFPGQAPASGGP